MDQWLRETVTGLEEARDTLASLSEEVAGEPDEGQIARVWESYLRVEKAVAFVKIELASESPGRTVRLKSYSVPDERQSIAFASRNLSRAIEELHLGNLGLALPPLREARNYLRALLRDKRMLRIRKARSSAGP